MTRSTRFAGIDYVTTDGAAVEVEEPTPNPEAPDPVPPEPGATTPTYPDDVPAPGALAYDAGAGDEGTASGTLSIQPSYALPLALRTRVAEFESDLGYTDRQARQTASRRGYDCVWGALSDADKVTVLTLFDASQEGAAQSVPFNWTPSGATAGTWVVRGVPRIEQLKRSAAWSVSARLVETR